MMTEQRQVILEELKKVSSHPTADEVFHIVRQRLPRISLGTVYRNLEILYENNLVHKLDWAGSQKRYDANIENHYHIRCVDCNRVEDVTMEPLGQIEETFRQRTDYAILGHRLEIIGVCGKCREEMPSRERAYHR
jgi:Fur family transcriptional regulator, ferric uptake regulator